MTYNEKLVERIRAIAGKKKGVTEKAMFGGISFLVDGKMFCGVQKEDLMARVNPEDHQMLVKKPHARPMDFTGKPMIGFLYISPEGVNTEKRLREWVEISLKFASTLPKKKKK